MKAKQWMIALLCFSLIFVLAACSGGNKGSSSGNEVTIEFWQFMGGDTEESATSILPMIAEFEKENPGIKVNVTQLSWGNGLEQITTAFDGNPPDLVELGNTWFGQFVAEDVLVDVTDEVQDVLDNHIGWDNVTYEGRIYGMPWLLGTRALFYNKELYREAGLDPEKPPTTWDELLAHAKAIHENTDASGYGLMAGQAETPWHQFLTFLWSNGGDVFTEDYSSSALDQPAAIEAMEFYAELAKYSEVAQSDPLNQAFAAGQIGLYYSGAWLVDSLPKNAPDLDWGVTVLPKAPTGKSVAFGGGEILVIPKKSKHQKEAIKLMKFVTKEENALFMTKNTPSVQPAIKGISEHEFFDDLPGIKIFAELNDIAKSPPNIPEWQKVEGFLTEAIDRVAINNEDPRQAMLDAHEKINKNLK